MRRLLVVLVVGLVVGGPGATAASAGGECPPEASGFVRYPIVGSIGDPAPITGAEPLWDILVDGATAEGLTVAELAASIGLDVDGLYNFVLGGWLRIDKNGDRNVCVRPFPEQGSKPAFIFNFIDNNAA
jgi:hypothetical protein